MESRIVDVTVFNWSVPSFGDFCIYVSSEPTTLVLRICYESQEVGLKHYTRVFKRSLATPPYFGRVRPIYMNLDKDIAFLKVGRNYSQTNLPDEDILLFGIVQEKLENGRAASEIRRVATPILSNTTVAIHLAILGRFLGLREVMLVVGKELLKRTRGLKLLDLDMTHGDQAVWSGMVARARTQLAQLTPSARIPQRVTLKCLQPF